MPFFSIIIPLYNKAPYIGKALESIKSQSRKDYEIIVVDDGSTDGSAEAAEKKAKECGLAIRLIRQSNAGVATARNNGVASASGDYICFLDADDWWEPGFLEAIYGLIEKYPDAGIYASSYYIVKSGGRRVAPIGVNDSFSDGVVNFCGVYAKTLCQPVWTGATCLPRDTFVGQGGFKPNLSLGEDFDLWLRISRTHPVALCSKPLSNYNQNADPKQRAISKLHPPESHMLWNLGYMEQCETSDKDYKNLIDRLRVYGLLPYWISKEYHSAAEAELRKVDWENVDAKWEKLYNLPIAVLLMREKVLKSSSRIKQAILRLIHSWR